MTTVREIMTRDVVTVEPGASLREAVETFRAEDVSGAPVTNGGEVVGVVSVTDILEFQATHPGVPVSRPEQTGPEELEPPATWEADEEEMPSAFFVDYWSDVGAEITSRFDETDGPEWDLLENHVVSEVMTRTVVSVPADASVREAAQRMLDAEIQRVLVLENGTLQGILTSTDVVRAVAQGAV